MKLKLVSDILKVSGSFMLFYVDLKVKISDSVIWSDDLSLFGSEVVRCWLQT